jgi:hypothetical protein
VSSAREKARVKEGRERYISVVAEARVCRLLGRDGRVKTKEWREVAGKVYIRGYGYAAACGH